MVSCRSGSLPPSMRLISGSALLDFCYLVRRNSICTDTLDLIKEALDRLHHYREIFIETGVRVDNISLPRQHALASITEPKHIKAVKKPWRRSSRKYVADLADDFSSNSWIRTISTLWQFHLVTVRSSMVISSFTTPPLQGSMLRVTSHASRIHSFDAVVAERVPSFCLSLESNCQSRVITERRSYSRLRHSPLWWTVACTRPSRDTGACCSRSQ